MKKQFRYEGMGSKKKVWGQQYGHGGLLIENCVQGIANDVLNEGLKRVHADGWRIPFHVHDEIVTEVRIDDHKRTLARLIELLTARIDWAPSLILGAAGWEGFFYRKD